MAILGQDQNARVIGLRQRFSNLGTGTGTGPLTLNAAERSLCWLIDTDKRNFLFFIVYILTLNASGLYRWQCLCLRSSIPKMLRTDIGYRVQDFMFCGLIYQSIFPNSPAVRYRGVWGPFVTRLPNLKLLWPVQGQKCLGQGNDQSSEPLVWLWTRLDYTRLLIDNLFLDVHDCYF